MRLLLRIVALVCQSFVMRAQRSQQRHSYVSCKRGNVAVDRLCHFKNVCWDADSKDFVYFADPAAAVPLTPTEAGMGRVHNGTHTLPVSVRSVGVTPVGDDPVFMSMRVTNSAIPMAQATFHLQRVAVAFESFWPENFGHSFGDDILPAASLLQRFGFKLADAQLVLIKPLHDMYRDDTAAFGRAGKHLDTFSTLATGRPVLDIHSATSNRHPPPSSSLLCFSHLLAGHSTLGFKYDGDFAWHRLRSAIICNAAAASPAVRQSLSSPITKHKVVFLEKHGRRRVTNTEALARGLRARFSVDVAVVDPSQLTFFDQIALMQQTTVLVTPPGGISMAAAFMRRHTPAIFFGYWDTRKNASSNMEQWFWRTTSSVTDLYYEVDFSEVQIPPNAGDPSFTSFESYRNFGCVSAKLEKLAPLVASALDTAAENNPLLRRSSVRSLRAG